jgi:hypothetical protein
MTAEKKTSRLAGLLYLIVVVTGIFSLAYVPSQIIVSGDPHTTVNNIMTSESLVVDVFGDLLVPGYADTAISRFVLLPASVGEIGTCLWLLIVGARHP